MNPNVSIRNRTSGGQVITVLTGNITGAANTTEASAALIKASTTLDGNFTAITLHSGSVVAYNK